MYAIHTHQEERQSESNITERARVLGITSEIIKDDVFEIHDKVKKAVDSIRNGDSRPFFFECMTYRWKEHVGPNDDFHLGYRSIEEAEPWFKNDQVKRVGGLLEPNQRNQLETEIESEIREAVDLAEMSPFPEASELYTQVFYLG